jgi:hypothetical protein
MSHNGFCSVFASLLCLFWVIVVSGCDLFNTSMVDYFLDHSEIAEATGFTVETKHIMENGTILIPPGETTIIRVTLSNPRNFTVRQELLYVPAGKNISSQQTGPTEIKVSIAGAAEGDTYEPTLVLQSPDGLRDFPSYALRVRCVSFETKLEDFTLDGVSIQDFDPAQGAFRVNVPYSRSTVVLGGTTEHSDALIELYAGVDDSGRLLATGSHTLGLPQNLEVGDNHFYVKITAPSSTAQGYAIVVHRSLSSEREMTAFNILSPANAAGSISGNAVTVIVPYGTDVEAMTASAVCTPGASISPDPAVARSYAAPVAYTVTAADGTSRAYTVTVHVARGIAIGGTIAEGFAALVFSGLPSSVTPGETITIAITGDVTPDEWYAGINGPESSDPSDSGSAIIFSAPMTPGYYNVNVIARVDAVTYSGSFGLTVDN